MSLAYQGSIGPAKPPRRVKQQPRHLRAPVLGEGEPGPDEVGPSLPLVIGYPALRHVEQLGRAVRLTGLEHRRRGGQRPA